MARPLHRAGIMGVLIALVALLLIGAATVFGGVGGTGFALGVVCVIAGAALLYRLARPRNTTRF